MSDLPRSAYALGMISAAVPSTMAAFLGDLIVVTVGLAWICFLFIDAAREGKT